MTKVSTMGTSSCATIAIGNFKDQENGDRTWLGKKANDLYLETGEAPEVKGKTVSEFYASILLPVKQDIGETGEYPFTKLMEEIDKSELVSKFIIATLNSSQQNKGYWPEQLMKWGFVLIDMTKNSIGSMNYVYTRNPSRPKKLSNKVSNPFQKVIDNA